MNIDNRPTMAEKTAHAVGLVCSVGVLLTAALYFAKLLPENVDGFFIMEPLLSVLMLSQGIRLWRRSRVTAVFSFAAALFIAVVTFIMLFSDRSA